MSRLWHTDEQWKVVQYSVWAESAKMFHIRMTSLHFSLCWSTPSPPLYLPGSCCPHLKAQALSGSFGFLYCVIMQTWNLSKNLHRRILRLKILHRQFHLISTVLVGKNTKNEWKWRNLLRWQKIYTAGFFRLKKFYTTISPTFNSFSGKKHKKCVKMEKFTPLAKVLHLTEWIFLPNNLLKVHFLLGNDFFVLKWVVSSCRQEMAKSTFGLTLSAQLIDLPLHRQFGRQVKV